jgi:hypothetical protein
MATAAAPKVGVTHARPKAKDDKAGGKKEQKIVYPSDFGSHASMVNAELTEKIAKQEDSDPWQILTDERGNYATRKHRIDTGMADPNRYSDLPTREKQLKELNPA